MTDIEDITVNSEVESADPVEQPKTPTKVENAFLAGGFAVVSDFMRSELEAELESLKDSKSGHAKSRRSIIEKQLGVAPATQEIYFVD